jgi:tetratricopeptide (TPR) repeat protein
MRLLAAILVLTLTSAFSALGQGSDELKRLPAPPKEANESAKGKNAKVIRMNELIDEANQAIQKREWQQLQELTQKLVAEDPSDWQFSQWLGNAQLNLGKYDEAIKTYEEALELVSRESDSSAHSELAKARVAATAKMLTNQGNAYLKLKKNDQALRAYAKAAALDPDPGAAYFNLCATFYNQGNVPNAISSCDKSIAADPTRADAYFIKGSSLYGLGSLDKQNKYVLPPGTIEALKKYLELSPTGGHAADVKAMLEAVDAKE